MIGTPAEGTDPKIGAVDGGGDKSFNFLERKSLSKERFAHP